MKFERIKHSKIDQMWTVILIVAFLNGVNLQSLTDQNSSNNVTNKLDINLSDGLISVSNNVSTGTSNNSNRSKLTNGHHLVDKLVNIKSGNTNSSIASSVKNKNEIDKNDEIKQAISKHSSIVKSSIKANDSLIKLEKDLLSIESKQNLSKELSKELTRTNLANEADVSSSLISENVKEEQASVKQTSLNRLNDDKFKNLNQNSNQTKNGANKLVSNQQDGLNRSINEINKLNNLSNDDVTVNNLKNINEERTIKKVDNSPDAESSIIDETKIFESRSTNDEDEFDEFEKDEVKKDDESSVIETDKTTNKAKNDLSDKQIRNKLRDNEETNESTPKSISSKKYGENSEDKKDENEEDESTNSSNLNNNGIREESSKNLTNSEHEEDEDDEEELDDEEINKKVANQTNEKKKSGERERESLLKLQVFLQNSVEQALKSALPELVKSSYETNLSPTCTNSFLAIARALQGTKQWAYKILDSSGKPPSGILEGTLTDFGSFELCLSVDTRQEEPDEVNPFTGKYCILDIKPAFDADIPFGSQPPKGIRNDSVIWHPALQLFWSRNSLLSFRYGLCAPSVCSDHDLQVLAQYFFKPTGMVAEVGFCQLSNEQHADTLQITIIFALSVILLTVFIGTVLEISLKRLDKQQLLTSTKKSLVDFLICFSILKNTHKLLNIKNKRNLAHKSQFKHLDGVRFLSTCWIIMGHTYFYTDFVHYHHFRSLAHFKYLDDNFWFMPIANFTLSVETYFFISGMLVVYANWKKLKNSNGKINILDFLIHRVWRIWPPYLVVIACTLILPLFGSGPLWPEAVKNTADICRKNWFYNILFINNFQKPDDVCLFHTWFLSANIQFHLAAIPLLFILYRYPKFCFSLCLTAILVCISWVFHYAQINNLTIPAVIADDVFVELYISGISTEVTNLFFFWFYSADQNILTLYILPYYHFGSYLLGMMFGYYLTTKTPTVLSGKLQLTLWSLCITLLCIVIFLPHNSFKGEPTSLLFSSLYLSLHRIAWSLAFGWLVYACSTGQGYFINSILSYEVFTSLSSLSYLAYLIHPVLMLYHTGMVRERVHLSHYQLLNTFLARVILAFSSAYILYVIVELPFSNIEKYLFPKSGKNKQISSDQIDSSKKPDIDNETNGNNRNITNNIKNHPHHQFNQTLNQHQQHFNTIGTSSFTNTNMHQWNNYHQKKFIPDYSTSMNRQFDLLNSHNFKEKHNLNLMNQRRQSNDKQMIDRNLLDRQLIDRRHQQNLTRLNQHYPYPLNEQDKKYLLYRQKPINQYYFYSGSRSNTLSNENRSNRNHKQNLNHSNELSNFSEIKTNNERLIDGPVQQTKTISSNERTITTCSLTNQVTNNLQIKQDNTIAKSTNDTQSTDIQTNSISNTISIDSSICETNQTNKNELSTASDSLN